MRDVVRDTLGDGDQAVGVVLRVPNGLDGNDVPERLAEATDAVPGSFAYEPVFKLSTFMADSQVPDPPGS